MNEAEMLVVRRAQHAGWQGHRPLHAASSPSGIYSLPETDRSGHPDGVGFAFNRGPLRNPQTPPRLVVVETASPFPFALYPDLQFLAQPGRALVPRDHRQTTAPGNLCQRARFDQNDHGLYRQSQPKPQGFPLDRFRSRPHEEDRHK